MVYCLLSPAKSLREICAYSGAVSDIDFKKETKQLVRCLQKMSCAELQSLLSVSDRLADLNYQRYQSFSPDHYTRDNAMPAVFLFQGDAYRTLDVDDMTSSELKRLQGQLGILSGLYGLLRPLDLIQPYRLEMGRRLAHAAGDDLYRFWRDHITEAINQRMSAGKSTLLVNLASQEYASAVNFDEIHGDVIDIQFKNKKNGVLKIIGIQAKKARGAMVRYIVRQRCQTVRDIMRFQERGYRYDRSLSTDRQLVFVAS